MTGVFASWIKKEEDEPSYEAQKQRVTKKTKKKLLMEEIFFNLYLFYTITIRTLAFAVLFIVLLSEYIIFVTC